MTKIRISGHQNIVGNNNTQINYNVTSEVTAELLALIAKMANNKDEEKSLEDDLKLVQEEQQSVVKRTQAAGRIAKWLKTVGGEAGRLMLQKLLDSGFEWAQHICAAAELIN